MFRFDIFSLVKAKKIKTMKTKIKALLAESICKKKGIK